jgi:hypothetical protein
VAIGLRLTLSANVMGIPSNDSVNAFLISSIIFEVRRNDTKLTGHNGNTFEQNDAWAKSVKHRKANLSCHFWKYLSRIFHWTLSSPDLTE